MGRFSAGLGQLKPIYHGGTETRRKGENGLASFVSLISRKFERGHQRTFFKTIGASPSFMVSSRLFRQTAGLRHTISRICAWVAAGVPRAIHKDYALPVAAGDGEIAIPDAGEEGAVFLLESVFVFLRTSVLRVFWLRRRARSTLLAMSESMRSVRSGCKSPHRMRWSSSTGSDPACDRRPGKASVESG